MSFNVFGLVSGDWAIFGGIQNSNGQQIVVGNLDEDTSHLVVGSFDADLGLWTVLAESGTSYYHYYAFDMDDRRMIGRAWVFPRSSSPSGNGAPFTGTRLLAKEELIYLSKSPAIKSQPVDLLISVDQIAEAAARAQSLDGHAPENILRSYRRLQDAMERAVH